MPRIRKKVKKKVAKKTQRAVRKKATTKRTKKTQKKKKTIETSSAKSFATARESTRKKYARLDFKETAVIDNLAKELSDKELRIIEKFYMDASIRHRARKVFNALCKRHNVTSGELELAFFMRTTGLINPRKRPKEFK